MKQFLSFLVFVAVFSAHTADPSVTLHSADQIPGTKTVEIVYDATDPDGDELDVTITVENGGSEIDSFAGSVGINQTNEWYAGDLYSNTFGSLTFKVTANDNQPVVPTNGLIAYYPFDGDVLDYSGNGNHGDPQGGVAFVDGKIGSSVSLNGSGKIEVSDSKNMLAPPNLSISGWINRQGSNVGSGAEGMVVYKGIYDPFGNMAYAIQLNDSNYKLSSRSDSSGSDLLFSNSTIGIGTWYHFVAVYDNNMKTHKLYIDGDLADQTTYAGVIKQTTEVLCIGAYGYNGGYYYKGIIDELRIYNRALSVSEIQQLYQAGQ